MKTHMTLTEIKALTKAEFTEMLISRGYNACDYPDAYRVLVQADDETKFKNICLRFGTDGYYSKKRKVGGLGNWGCHSPSEELPPKQKKDIQKVLQEVKLQHEAYIKKSGFLDIITIANIAEKPFRKIMVKHNCSCITYNEKTLRGLLLL